MMRCFERKRQYILIHCSLLFNVVAVLGGGKTHKCQACPLPGGTVLPGKQNHRVMEYCELEQACKDHRGPAQDSPQNHTTALSRVLKLERTAQSTLILLDFVAQIAVAQLLEEQIFSWSREVLQVSRAVSVVGVDRVKRHQRGTSVSLPSKKAGAYRKTNIYYFFCKRL